MVTHSPPVVLLLIQWLLVQMDQSLTGKRGGRNGCINNRTNCVIVENQTVLATVYVYKLTWYVITLLSYFVDNIDCSHSKGILYSNC